MRLEYMVNLRRLAIFLGVIALFFALQSLVMEYLIEDVLDPVIHAIPIQIIDLFSVNAEQTIPTWYATFLLFGAAVLLAHIAAAQRARHEPLTGYWVGLALIFLYLSIDEGAAIHEIASDALEAFATTTGYLTFPWLMIAVPLVAIFGALYLRFLLHLPTRTRNLFMLAGVVYVGGAVVIEAVSANQWSLDGGVSFSYLAIATVEEFCEMLGIIVFIYALLSYAAEKQYSFAFILPSPNTAESAAMSAVHQPALFPVSRRLLAFFAGLILFLNAALIVWALSQPPGSQSRQFDNPLQVLIDQFPSDDVVMTRMIGRFGGDNLAARQVVAGLLNAYDDVLIIMLPTMESSIALAADELPFDRDNVIEILHAMGETQFVIYDTSAVRVLVGDLTTKR